MIIFQRNPEISYTQHRMNDHRFGNTLPGILEWMRGYLTKESRIPNRPRIGIRPVGLHIWNLNRTRQTWDDPTQFIQQLPCIIFQNEQVTVKESFI